MDQLTRLAVAHNIPRAPLRDRRVVVALALAVVGLVVILSALIPYRPPAKVVAEGWAGSDGCAVWVKPADGRGYFVVLYGAAASAACARLPR